MLRISKQKFPKTNYLLNEASYSVNHLDPVKDYVARQLTPKTSFCQSELDTSSFCSEKVLLNAINAKFTIEHIKIKIIGNEITDKILQALNLSREELPAQTAVYDGDEYGTDMALAHICQSELNEEMLAYLDTLSDFFLRYVVFITDDDGTNKYQIGNQLSKRFPKTFGNSNSCPIFATTATLERTIDEILSEIVYDLLDMLLETSKACLKIISLSPEKQIVFQEMVTDLASLTQERPCRRNSRRTLECVPQQIRERLSGLEDRGILAYTIYQGRLIIFVHTTTKDNDIKLLENILSVDKKSYQILYSETPIFKPHVSNGHEIRPKSPSNESFGTLGVFAKDTRNNDLFALTSGHVVIEGENIFTPDKEKLGKCVLGPDIIQHSSDLSVIKIDAKIKPKCQTVYQNLSGERFNITNFEGKKTDLVRNQRVSKIGAKTGETRGRIVSEIVQLDFMGEFLLIEGFHNKPFSEGGDSGSIVCMNDPKDPTTKIALSMVFGGEPQIRNPTNQEDELQNEMDNRSESEGAQENNILQLKNTSCTFMLNEALKNIEHTVSLEFIKKDS